MKTLRRGKLVWMLFDESIIVVDHWQATIYQLYGYPNRKPLLQMQRAILDSGSSEYGNWAEALTLAARCGIRGMSTAYKEEWKQYFEYGESNIITAT